MHIQAKKEFKTEDLKPVRLSKPAILNRFVQPISLPTSCVNQGSGCSIIVGPKNLSEAFSPGNRHDYIWATDKHTNIHADYMFTSGRNKLISFALKYPKKGPVHSCHRL